MQKGQHSLLVHHINQPAARNAAANKRIKSDSASQPIFAKQTTQKSVQLAPHFMRSVKSR